MLCLREPSLGPVVRHEGRRRRRRLCAGRADGGHQSALHRRLHAIGSRTICSPALLDNHIYWGNELGIDVRRIAWKRVVDMNDRALRDIVVARRPPTAFRARTASTSSSPPR
jgi:formate--tetrahydrofolate ligase